MSQKDMSDRAGRLEVSEFPSGDLSKLADLARQAYEQKNTKECLDLTRAMLLIDPDNTDAQRLRSLIQSEMHRDLENARAFLRTAHSKEKLEKQSQPNLAVLPAGSGLDSHAEGAERSLSTRPSVLFAVPGNSRRVPRTRWLVGAAVVFVPLLVFAALPRFRAESIPVQPPPPTLTTPAISAPVSVEAAVAPDAFLPRPEVKPALPDPSVVEAASRTPAIVSAVSGTLAISSTASADIYKDDVYLGSVPVSLALPAGSHTLEYRHGNLRRNVTHVIYSNQTTKAMITFDVSVQINSKPWAEVFVDGVARRALGQTPLSGVKVPIGSVLIFENPQFQPKRYRVIGNETGIQIVFP